MRYAELSAELDAERQEVDRLQCLLQRVTEEARKQQDKLALVQSDGEMATQMWRAQADDAMQIAESSALHEKALAQELERLRAELWGADDLHEELRRLKRRLVAAESAEATASAKRISDQEELRRVEMAAKEAEGEHYRATERMSTQLNRARHTIESLQRAARFGSDTSQGLA